MKPTVPVGDARSMRLSALFVAVLAAVLFVAGGCGSEEPATCFEGKTSPDSGFVVCADDAGH